MVSAISDLGVGENAWIQNTNFLLFGVVLIAYAIGYRRALAPYVGAQATRGAIVIGTAALGIFGAVVFPATPETRAAAFPARFPDRHGRIRSRRLPGRPAIPSPARRPPTGPLLYLDRCRVVVLFGCVFLALNPASPLEQAGIGGLINRILAIVVFAWYAVTGAWLRQSLSHDSVTNVDEGHDFSDAPA